MFCTQTRRGAFGDQQEFCRADSAKKICQKFHSSNHLRQELGRPTLRIVVCCNSKHCSHGSRKPKIVFSHVKEGVILSEIDTP
jgi:hypothetical protein